MSETKKTKSVLGDMAPSESSLPLARDLAWVCQEITDQLVDLIFNATLGNW